MIVTTITAAAGVVSTPMGNGRGVDTDADDDDGDDCRRII
jgi:hypothetical protein